jgi:hypothetical protein
MAWGEREDRTSKSKQARKEGRHDGRKEEDGMGGRNGREDDQ